MDITGTVMSIFCDLLLAPEMYLKRSMKLPDLVHTHSLLG